MAGQRIDNYDIEFDKLYAERQKQLDPEFFNQAKAVSSQTTLDVTSPILVPEMEVFLQTSKRYLPIALFNAPPTINPQIAARCFKQSLAPSLGTNEKIEHQEHKVKEYKMDPSSVTSEDLSEKDLEWFQQQQINEVEKEKEALLNFFSTMKQMNKDLSTIEGFRHQFNRG